MQLQFPGQSPSLHGNDGPLADLPALSSIDAFWAALTPEMAFLAKLYIGYCQSVNVCFSLPLAKCELINRLWCQLGPTPPRSLSSRNHRSSFPNRRSIQVSPGPNCPSQSCHRRARSDRQRRRGHRRATSPRFPEYSFCGSTIAGDGFDG